jgi:hypothetical protein
MTRDEIVKITKNSIFFVLLWLIPTFTFAKSDSKVKKEKYRIWIYWKKRSN